MLTRMLLILIVTSQVVEAPRSRQVILNFEKLTGHPNGWPGHVVDHQVPLCAGGPDIIENLQWQEVSKSYLKDNFERELCRNMHRLGLVMVKQ